MGKILKIKESEATLKGAGVHLYRALGFSDTIEFDSFLLLDVFHSENP